MIVTPTPLAGVLRIESHRFRDDRGVFFELAHEGRLAQAGIAAHFVQDNVSYSRRGVIRGLHYQQPNGQAKLATVLHGCVYDVAVDIRRGSPNFGKHYGIELSEENGIQLFIPAGFAHGFAVLSESATFVYKCSALYDPSSEHSVLWNDPALGIQWPVAQAILSSKDADALPLNEVPAAFLPEYGTLAP